MIKKYDDNAEKVIMYGSNPERNFFYDSNMNPDIFLKWDNSTNGSFDNTSFLAYDSLIIISDLSGRISVLQLSDGKKVAELKYTGSIEQAPVLFNTFLLFIVNENKENYSTFIVYDIVNGKEVNKLKLKGKFGNELLLAEEHIFAISDFGLLYKIAPWGNIVWEKELDVNVYSNPASDHEYIFIPTSEGEILKVSLENGDIKEAFKISRGFESGIYIEMNNLLIGDNEGILFSINKENGGVDWKFDSGFKIVQTPGADNHFVYFGNLHGDLYSIDKRTGKINWRYESNGLITASPLIFRNIIFQPNMLMSLDILDISSGKLINHIEYDLRCRTNPLFYKNNIVFGFDKGDIYCYGINDIGEENK